MKCFISILVLINVSCFAQDTLPIYSHHYLVEKEIACCKRAKNQLKCVDSLIQLTENALDLSEKVDPKKAPLDRLRKLSIYHFNAGIISGLRGNLEQSFLYFDKMGLYLDTLSKNGKGDEFKTLKSLAVYQKTEFCIKSYSKDTAVFNRCNCRQFFPEVIAESSVPDTAIFPHKTQTPPIKYPNWGAFYVNDTLRINTHFVSDLNSISYFKKWLQPQLLTKFLQHEVYLEILGEPSFNLKRDTVIYKLTSKYEKGKYDRTCELVFTSSKHPEKFDYLMLLINNIEFPGLLNDLEIYIPIVVSANESIHISNATIFDDHFLIEVPKLEPIKRHH